MLDLQPLKLKSGHISFFAYFGGKDCLHISQILYILLSHCVNIWRAGRNRIYMDFCFTCGFLQDIFLHGKAFLLLYYTPNPNIAIVFK